VSVSAAGLSISRDTDAVKESVQAFVDSFNELRTTMQGMAGSDSNLDSTLRSIESQMRGVFNTAPTGLTTGLTYLAEVGVAFERDGSLSLDADNLEAAVESDFAGFAELFANDSEGYLFRLEGVVDSFVVFDGLLDDRKDSINRSVRSVDDRIFEMQFRLEQREQSLLDRFNTLDNLMGQLQGTSAFLTQQLATLPTISSGSGN
jgi:flagellar hook-associated protein 2